MWAAGFLESIFTYNDIINFFENVQDNNKHNKENKELLKQFLKEIDINLDNKINNQHFMEQLNETELKYWTQVIIFNLKSKFIRLGSLKHNYWEFLLDSIKFLIKN